MVKTYDLLAVKQEVGGAWSVSLAPQQPEIFEMLVQGPINPSEALDLLPLPPTRA